MDTVVVQVNNNSAFRLLENLEALNVIKMLRRTPYPQSDVMEKPANDSLDRATRLLKIRSITGNICVDLTSYKFNRDEANRYE